jgi:hypothetical protein
MLSLDLWEGGILVDDSWTCLWWLRKLNMTSGPCTLHRIIVPLSQARELKPREAASGTKHGAGIKSGSWGLKNQGSTSLLLMHLTLLQGNL